MSEKGNPARLRARKCGPLLLAVLACGTICASASDERIEFTAEGEFSQNAIRRGVKAIREQCEAIENAVWASTAHHGAECIRYWTSGFGPAAGRRAIVFFHGDRWNSAFRGGSSYVRLTGEALARDARRWSEKLSAPYLFVARPGTHGSSGEHGQRRRIAESLLISAALDLIKDKLGISELVVSGQSGGGHVVSALLTHRADIVCAVPTSAPSSPRVRWKIRGWATDSTGFSDSYEPAEHLLRTRMHPALRVFVLGDPEDANVVWASQRIMSERLQDAGIAVTTLHGEGTGRARHGLQNSARIVAGWCYHDLPTSEIVRKTSEGLRG